MSKEKAEESTDTRRLPKEKHAHCIRIQDLAGLLAKKSIISEDEYEGLVIQGFMIPRLDAATKANAWKMMNEFKVFMGLKPIEAEPDSP